MNMPISNENSIESSSFFLVFERDFSSSELQLLARLQKVFEQELPAFKELSEISFNIEKNAVINSHENISGTLLQSFDENDKPAWSLKVEKNIIEVSCFTYDKWDNVWTKAQGYLSETIKSIESPSNKLVVCILKVVDKFLASTDNYNIENAFNSETLEFEQYFSVESNNFYNEKNIRDFVLKHKLNDFLLWVNTLIADTFGDIKKSLKLVKCWDDEDYHMVLEIFSEQNNMDELSLLEDGLFKKLESHPEIDYALQYIVIAQR